MFLQTLPQENVAQELHTVVEGAAFSPAPSPLSAERFLLFFVKEVSNAF
jgi:hypothetical protein